MYCWNLAWRILSISLLVWGFPGGSEVKASIPWRRKWQPTQVFLPRIPWTEELGSLQSMGSQRVGHDWVTSLSHQWAGLAPETPQPCPPVGQHHDWDILDPSASHLRIQPHSPALRHPRTLSELCQELAPPISRLKLDLGIWPHSSTPQNLSGKNDFIFYFYLFGCTRSKLWLVGSLVIVCELLAVACGI